MRELPYTPTTDEVRARFADWYGEYRDIAEGWFDRWLARVRAEAYAHGYKRGYSDCSRGLPCTTVPNPYTEEVDQ